MGGEPTSADATSRDGPSSALSASNCISDDDAMATRCAEAAALPALLPPAVEAVKGIGSNDC